MTFGNKILSEYLAKECYTSEIKSVIIYLIQLLGDDNVAVSYSRLWKLLVDKKMSKADLRKAANISPNTMTKLRRDEYVAMEVLARICLVLNVDFGDIVHFIKE